MADTNTITKTKRNFTSYLETEAFNGGEDARQSNLRPKFLNGELEVIRARNVLLYSPSTKIKDDKGVPGLLVLTNFKLTFLSVDNPENLENDCPAITHQENSFLGKNDITLSNIDCIYQISDRKKRLVEPYSRISSKLEALHIICKNFRVVKFGFKRSEVGKGKQIAEALSQFAFPNQHNLLFCYNFRENYYNTLRNVSMFTERIDWSHELIRCGATGWRVLSIEREDNIPMGTMPMHFVIPKSVSEIDYLKLSNFFRNTRTAIWVYSVDNAALVRMAELMPTITDTKQENTMLELVRKCDPLMRQPCLMELTKLLPSIQEVYNSYIKLRELCTPDSMRQFMVQDNRFYGLLDKSCWILYVSLCLKYSNEAALKMRNGITVVLQENDARDMCCVISSLTQILLDSHYRTINGFQSLIQKEWVALGHPFSDRLGHVINSDTTEQSPLFLLFLDCTWQLLQQFPEEFEFSEIYLTTLWDSAFLPLFDTFQFNSEHDRQVARKNERLILRPIWDWSVQFTDSDIIPFTNSLYKKPPESSRKSMAVLPPNAIPLPGFQSNSRFTINLSANAAKISNTAKCEERKFLEPQWTVRNMEIWMHCYYRWLPILDIKYGGYAQIDNFNRKILNNIKKLQHCLRTQNFDDLPLEPLQNNGETVVKEPD